MPDQPPTARAKIEIDAPPEQVYDLVADVTRMGEWSPECYRCDWVGGTSVAQPGAQFRGRNKFKGVRWSRLCEVTKAERGRELSFRTVPTGVFRDSTQWTFRFAPAGSGTLVEQRCDVLKQFKLIEVVERFINRPGMLEQGMQQTLERIKAAAETPSAAG